MPERDDLAELMRERRLDIEDLEVNLAAAMASARKGLYATSRAQINGALLILDKMTRRAGER